MRKGNGGKAQKGEEAEDVNEAGNGRWNGFSTRHLLTLTLH